jgi:glycosyltransferase involved in cell wall biosynthesis
VTRVVLAHDYLGQFGGAEKVVVELCRTFPDAPLYVSYYEPERTYAEFRRHRVHTTFLDRAPGIRRRHRAYAALYPVAFGLARLPDCDVVLSSSSAFAKGVRVPPGAVHVCYCHSPMRFAWGLDRYLDHESLGHAVTRTALRPLMAGLRSWDLRTNATVDVFLANSRNTAARITRLYGRPAEVVYPPVDLDGFSPDGCGPDDYYLVVSRLSAYKRVDLAVEACTRLGRRLLIVGDGPMRARLQAMAGPTVEFLGSQPQATLARLMARCRALVFCSDDDFGITPVEAMASGRPVVALGAGGALETVVDGQTGLFFSAPSVASLTAALRELEARPPFAEAACRARAERFGAARFRDEVAAVVEKAADAADGGSR